MSLRSAAPCVTYSGIRIFRRWSGCHMDGGAQWRRVKGAAEQSRLAAERVAKLRRQLDQAERAEKAWAAGAEGEARVAQVLDELSAHGWHALHDVRWPGRPKANLDHVLVGPGGIIVMDAKKLDRRRADPRRRSPPKRILERTGSRRRPSAMRGRGRAPGAATPPLRTGMAVHGRPAIVAGSIVWRQNSRPGYRNSGRTRATGCVGCGDSSGHPQLPGRTTVGQQASAATDHSELCGRGDVESPPPTCRARSVTGQAGRPGCEHRPAGLFTRFSAEDPTTRAIQRLPACAPLLGMHHLFPWHSRKHVASLGPAGSRGSEPLTLGRQNCPNPLTSQAARSCTASSAELADWQL